MSKPDEPPADLTPEQKLMEAIFGQKADLPEEVSVERAFEVAVPPPPPPSLTDAAKEQVKLRATYFNQLGVALFAVGGLAPILKASTDSELSTGVVSTIVVSSIICFVLSGVLHYRAYEHLRELDK